MAANEEVLALIGMCLSANVNMIRCDDDDDDSCRSSLLYDVGTAARQAALVLQPGAADYLISLAMAAFRWTSGLFGLVPATRLAVVRHWGHRLSRMSWPCETCRRRIKNENFV